MAETSPEAFLAQRSVLCASPTSTTLQTVPLPLQTKSGPPSLGLSLLGLARESHQRPGRCLGAGEKAQPPSWMAR